jgi:hypothetical protein
MSKKIVWVIVGIIVLAGVFYGGMTYGGNNVRAAISSRSQGLGTGNFAGRTGGARGAGGFTTGQIISENSTSITVALASGGSKIVFLDNTTPITKQANGTIADLAVGTNVMVTGTANTDGSISAQSVQIRPKMPAKNTTP